MDVPVIETARLRLRGHRIDDFADSAAMWSSAEVTRYIGGRPFTAEEVWTRLLRYVGHWQCLGFGYWVIEDAATRQFLGELGFADYKRDITPSFNDTPEAGWALAPHAHGKGYATEALSAIVRWGDKHFQGALTACMINPQNTQSIRVAEKCGYKRTNETTYHGAPVLIYAR
jgi:RimJ/RimL family protein N-acetyltransferase